MSIKAYAWAKAVKAGSPTRKAVLCAIADYADDHGVAWPSLDRIANDTEFSARAVRMAVAELADLGLLTRQKRFRPDGGRSSDVLTLQTHISAPLAPGATPIESPATPIEPPATPLAANALPVAPDATPPSRTFTPRTTTKLPLNGSEAIASGVPAIAVPPVEMSIEDRLWFEGRASLMETGMPHKQAGSMIGRWISQYGDHARILEAIRQACASGTQDALPFVVAILGGPEGRPRASPGRGRRSGMVGIALNDYGRELQ